MNEPKRKRFWVVKAPMDFPTSATRRHDACVGLLVKALRHARDSGDVSGAIVFLRHTNGETSTLHNTESVVETVGALELLKWRLLVPED